MIDLTVIIVNYNTRKLLDQCLESIFQGKTENLKVWVVDNASTDDSISLVKKKYPQVRLIASKTNLGYAGGNNKALKEVKTPYCLLLNSDTKVLPNSLGKLVDFMQKEDYGIGSCQLVNSDGSFQPNTGDLPFGLGLFFWLAGFDDLPIIGSFLPSFHQKYLSNLKDRLEVGWVAGTAMIIKDRVISKIGLLDDHLFMYAEDVDYCFRAKRAGFKIGWTNEVKIIHLGGGSLKEPQLAQWLGEFRGLVYLYKKYFGDLASIFLKMMIYFFILLRVIAFLMLGKFRVSKTYAKVLVNF